jgi:8-oxo-dGTP pyrophosphatase MutT (NUDIX family)
VSRREREREVVAAVCHRCDEGSVELLLVRTKGGKRWTFPKGHVEPGEGHSEAAAREAREEAGVEGEVAPAPFTRYRYPSTRDEEGESLVSAYLLEVLRQEPPAGKERRRDPTWVGPEEAMRLLAAGGREPVYAEEHARVVREAVAALSLQE